MFEGAVPSCRLKIIQGRIEWIHRLNHILDTHNLSISHVLLTHWHGDHTGGIPHLLAAHPYLESKIFKCCPDSGQNAILDGSVFRTEGATIRAIFTPGHSTDHMSFVLEEENAMFTGDNVLGHGYTVVEDLATYQDSLQYMSEQSCLMGYPGHGSTIANLPLIMNKYIYHRLLREMQILTAFSSLSSIDVAAGSKRCKGITTEDLVIAIYGSVSAELVKNVLEPAITEVLWKLASERRIGFQRRLHSREWFLMVKR
jgi:hydrolase